MKLEVDKIKEILQKYPVDFAYLFGSLAEGTARSWSDVDIALIVPESIAQNNHLRLEMDVSKKIDEVLPNAESDVRIFNQAPLNYKIQLVQNGKLIFSKNETKRIDFETKVRDEYFDFLPKSQENRSILFDNIQKGGLLWSTRKK